MLSEVIFPLYLVFLLLSVSWWLLEGLMIRKRQRVPPHLDLSVQSGQYYCQPQNFPFTGCLVITNFLEKTDPGTHCREQGGCGDGLTSDALQVHDFDLVEV